MNTIRGTMPITLASQARILVAKMAGLGDLLLALPTLRALRTRYPNAQIDVLTSPIAAPLLADSPLIEHIYTLSGTGQPTSRLIGRAANIRAALTTGTRLRQERYDALLLLHHLTLTSGVRKHRALVRMIGAQVTAGLDNGRGDFLDLRVEDAGFGARHEAEYFAEVAAAVGAQVDGSPQGPTMADLGWTYTAERNAASKNVPRVALHVGSGTYSVARRWPVERFAELAIVLHKHNEAEIVLVGGPEDAGLSDEVMTSLEQPSWAQISVSDASPGDLARTLASCDLFVGNDSFPMHLATAVRVPVVALFGPSNAMAWGPYAPEAPERVAVVRRDDLPCSPCFYRGHALGTPQGCPPRPCLTELGIQPVLAAAERLLRQAASVAPDD